MGGERRTVVGLALRRSDDCSNHSVLVLRYGILAKARGRGRALDALDGLCLKPQYSSIEHVDGEFGGQLFAGSVGELSARHRAEQVMACRMCGTTPAPHEYLYISEQVCILDTPSIMHDKQAAQQYRVSPAVSRI